MKNYSVLSVLALVTSTFIGINGCKKDTVKNPGPSQTEEFHQVYALDQNGWIFKDNTKSYYNGTAAWTQGTSGTDKAGVMYGFSAYSGSADDYVYSAISFPDSTTWVSSWMITPVLSVKNGDVLSFYTRSDLGNVNAERLQVLLNNSSSSNVGDSIYSVGDFTTVLFDINAEQEQGTYPQNWTRYEYTFTGFAEKTERRIAFRHYVEKAVHGKGVGIDLFQFKSK